MDQELPAYMNIIQICALKGVSRYQFRRLADTFNLPFKRVGQAKLYEVKPILELMAQMPEVFGYDNLKETMKVKVVKIDEALEQQEAPAAA